MRLIALRGATTVEANEAQRILTATGELMQELLTRNKLDAEFPAVAAREMGLSAVPLLCTREVPVPGSLPHIIRVLIHCYGEPGHEAQHVYLGEAAALRLDLSGAQ